jgi:hypothetical protein
MAGHSKYCAVCNKELRPDGPKRHLCPEHADYTLVVVDSQLSPDPHCIGEIWR